MNPLKLLLSAVLATASLCLISCYKDHPDVRVVSRTGLLLSPDQEVPAKTAPSTGTADVSYNKDTKLLTYTLNWKDLTGAPTGAHIHGTARRGANAGIKHDFTTAFPKTVSGTFSSSVMVDGVNIREDSLLRGAYYFNIHTALNPTGEIRGQIEF